MENSQYKDFGAAQPYFDLIREALGNLVQGDHFFDIVTDETIYEVLYQLGWPRMIKGRTDLMEAFRGYCEAVELRAADHLNVYKVDGGRIVIVEYEVHGSFLSSGTMYDNRFCSIITLENGKIAHWRDYMDSHAAWLAMTAPNEQAGSK